MDIQHAIESRYSERKFTGQPVTREQIAQLMKAAWHAPCSCNLQLMHYVIVDEPSLREKLAHVATRKMLWAPVNILFFLDPRFTVHRHSAVMGLGAAMQNMSLTAVSLGLGTCPMAGFKGDRELKKILNVPDFLDPILIMGVGYPQKSSVAKTRQRIPLETNVHFNSFEGTGEILKASDNLDDWLIADLINYRRRIGPVYRYGERFSLHIFNDLAYLKAAEIFKDKLSRDGRQVLDLFSYDSFFVKSMQEVGVTDQVTVSDYFPTVTTQITELYPAISYCEILDSNVIKASDAQFDIVTMVHKVAFTPQLPKLFAEVQRVLKPGGTFFITYEKMSWPKRITYAARRLFMKYLSFQAYNVYEENPYYKIGPHRFVSRRSLIAMNKRAGLKLVEHNTINLATTAKFKSDLAYAIFKK